MVIYLDLCCFNRPFDNQTSMSIYLETEAKLYIQDLVKEGKLQLIWSYILDFENSANPDSDTSFSIKKWDKLSSKHIVENFNVLSKANEFYKIGIGVKDSLHIACAVDANAQSFITVDNGILKRKNLIKTIEICSPVDFIHYWEENNEN